jgi:hypothetical protein
LVQTRNPAALLVRGLLPLLEKTMQDDKGLIRNIWAGWVRPHIAEPIKQQRVKLIWLGWGYWPLLLLESLSLTERLRLMARFLRVDWFITHTHSPSEITNVCRTLARRRAREDEVVLEAGCWQGGSSVKFSIICAMLGYKLQIYDSFEGVEKASGNAGGNYDFSGEYAASEVTLRRNLAQFGEPEVCRIHKGWFVNTLANAPVSYPIRMAYIDCDLAKGTKEALAGIVPSLVADGQIFSQDFHIKPVEELLRNPATWASLHKGVPAIKRLNYSLAIISFTGNS